jgi:hypothetical protein
MNSAGFVGGGVRRNNGEPSVGAAALWTSILWKRMEKLMDDMYNGCVKVLPACRDFMTFIAVDICFVSYIVNRILLRIN